VKKRLSALVLALALFVTLLAPLAPRAQAATSSYAPYANIYYDYTPITVAGTIRYIAQKTESSYFDSRYWGQYVSRASYNCSTSCISMALSYIGIDTTPEDVLDYNILTVFTAPYGGSTPKSYTYDKLSTAMDNYLNGDGKYSPPVIHLDEYSAGGHYVMLVGKIGTNQYQVMDPATSKLWTIKINGKTATYTYPYGSKTITDNIDNTGTGDVYQWYNPDAKLMKDVTVRKGKTASTTVTADGSGLSYTWYFADKDSDSFSKSTLCTGKTYSVEMNEIRDGRRVYCKITDKSGKSFTTETVTLNMVPVLTITKQPESVRVLPGATATVKVTATGSGLTYAWYFADAGSETFTKSSIADGNTYSVEMTDARDGRRLYCVITDKYGDSVKTETVTISQKTPVSITKQPESVTVKLGETASATVEAVGDGLSYAWYYTTGAGSSKFYKSSNTTDTYSVEMNTSRDGRKVYCKVTDQYGNTVTSKTVTLHMKEGDPVKIVTQPVSVTVAEGETASATVEAVGDGLTYAWYFTSNKSDKTFSKSSTTGATYSTTMDSSRDGRKIYCKVTDVYGNTVTSDTVTLKMSAPTATTPLAITKQPENVTVAEGETASTSVVATGEGLKYTWYYTSNGSDSRFFKSSTTTATYSTVMNETRDGRKIYCVITDKYGDSVTTATVTLSMGEEEEGGGEETVTALAITRQPENVTVKAGETASTFVEATGDGLSYAWYYTSNGTTSKFYKSSITAATYATTMDSSRDGRKIYCVITDKYGKSVTSNTVTLTMGSESSGGSSEDTTPSGANATVTSSDGLNVRSGAGTSYSIVAKYNKGQRIEILETKTVGTTVWGKTVDGWVSMDYVQMDGESVPEVRTVTATSLTIRATASTSGKVVGYLYKGDTVSITEKKTAGGYTWGKCSKGWIALEFTK